MLGYPTLAARLLGLPGSGDFIAQIVGLLLERRQSLGWLGIAGFAIAATGILSVAEVAVSRAWGVRPRGLLRRRVWLLEALAVLLFCVVACTALVMVPFRLMRQMELVELRASAGPPGALTALLWLIGSSGLFVLGYRYLPARRTQWREVVPAAALSLALWAPVTVVLTRYMQSAVSPTRFYGSLGAVVALLSWLYYFGLVFLFGAELSALRKRQA